MTKGTPESGDDDDPLAFKWTNCSWDMAYIYSLWIKDGRYGVWKKERGDKLLWGESK